MLAAFLIVLARSRGNVVEALQIMLPNLLHIQNYVLDSRRPVGQSWSLAVEEHFYLVLPLFLWLVWRFRRATSLSLPAIPLTAFFLCVVCALFRLIGFYNPGTNFFATHMRIDSLFWGVMLAYLFHFKPEKLKLLMHNRALLILLGLVLLSPMILLERSSSAFMRSAGLTMLSWGYGCLLLAFVYTPLGEGVAGKFMANPVARFIAWIGVHSYTIYLWFGILGNKPTEAIFRRLPQLPSSINWLCQFSTFLILSILGGVIMFKIFDSPVLKLRDRFFPARATTIPAYVGKTET
jgi:peptidoglycan/LPS O-acetylase OafA/YrhL